MLFSSFGALIQQVGAAWLMTTLTHSKQLVALVQASATIPIMLLAVFAGAIADSYDRKRVMLIAQFMMLSASTLLAIFVYWGHVTPVLLLIMTLAVGLGTTLNGPAWQASLRMQVPPEDVPAAVSLNSISFNLARSVGPALGGFLISLAGPSLNFTVNACSYIGIIIALSRWKPSHLQIDREPIMRAIGRGVLFCWSVPEMKCNLFRAFVFGFSGAALWSLMPLVARDLLHGNQLTYGFLLGGFGAGSIIAAFYVTQLRLRVGNDRTITLASLLFASGSYGAAVLGVFWVDVLMTFLAGMGWVSALTTFNVVTQARAPDDIAGRCLSIYHMCAFGGLAIGSYAWGGIADVRDVQFALLASACLLALSPLLSVFAPVPDHYGSMLD